MIAALVLLGFAIGTFAEYVVHRALHLPWLYRFHQGHHDNPTDYAVGGSWKVYLGIVAAIAAALAFIHWGVALGFLLWYGFFTGLHYSSHHISAAKRSWIDYLQDQHIAHHNDPSKNYSVTMPLWDWLFRSYVAGEDKNSTTGAKP